MSSSSLSILKRARSGSKVTRVKSFLFLCGEIFAGPSVPDMLFSQVWDSLRPDLESAVSTVNFVEKMFASLAP